MRKITLDIETSGNIKSGGDFSELELTIACVHDSESGEFKSFLQPELSELWPILEHADLLIGYNSDHFDIPILNKYYQGDLARLRSLDLLKEIKNVLGRRLKLDNIAEATLGRKKSGYGLQAAQWWEKGEVEKVRAYCIDDVKLTLELYEHAHKHGALKYRDFDGVRDIKLNTSGWEQPLAKPAITHTLPF